MECLFCKIANKEIPGEVIYEDASATGVLDIHPCAPGHAMILPKVHAETIADLPEDAMGPVFLAVRNVVNILKHALHPDGFTIGINHGKVAGQVIEHLHIHVIPRWHSDKGGSIHSVVSNPSSESVQEIRSKIQHSIQH